MLCKADARKQEIYILYLKRKKKNKKKLKKNKNRCFILVLYLSLGRSLPVCLSHIQPLGYSYR